MNIIDKTTRWDRKDFKLSRGRLLYLAPMALVLVILFAIPVGRIFAQAFQYNGAFGMDHFQHILSSSGYRSVITRTLRISAATTLITAVLGYALAYYIVFKSEHKQLLLLLVFVTMTVDLVVRIFGLIITFSRDGLAESLLTIIFDDVSLLFTEGAIVIGLVQFVLPFMIFVMVGVLSNIDTDLLEAARDLGASRVQIFFRLTVPLSAEGIIVGTSLVFALSMSSFVSPQLLGGGQNRMVANTIYSIVFQTGDWGTASALGVILLLITMSIIVVISRSINALVGVINR